MVLLAVCVGARPVVLAPLALRAPGTLNAKRGAKARGGGSCGYVLPNCLPRFSTQNEPVARSTRLAAFLISSCLR